MSKTYSQAYIFTQYKEYERKMYEFIISAERIDTKGKAFEDILYDIKRRKISDALTSIITSNNVVFGINPSGKSLQKALKVFVAKDVKEDKSKLKVFIDVTDCIMYKNGTYVCNKLEWLISYAINAMTSYIYAIAPNKLLGNASILKDGGDAFVRCFSYIIDRMYKISTVQQLRYRVSYMSALYYQICILGKDINKQYDSIKANAIKISDIEPRDAQIVDIMIQENDFNDLNTFTNALSRIFNFKDLKLSNIVSYWMNAFGTGTVFALEFFPAFSAMMTNTYIGGYLDQQLSIEKVAGQSMVKFVKTIMQIGESVV